MQEVRGSSPLSPTTPPRIPMAKTAEKTIRLDIDSRSLEGDDGATLGQLMRAQYPEGFERGVAAKLNGQVVDFHTPIHESGRVDLLSLDSPEGLQVLRHSTAHLMASAVVKLFPEAKLAIGPAIEEGFYYDFQVDRPFQPEDLEKIEKLMHEIAEENHPFVRGEMKRTDAIREFREKRDNRKLGHDLDLFSVHEEAGGGLIFWHPHGAAMRRVIEDFWKDEHLRRGYQLVNTPHIAQVDLWEQSGHTGFYRQNMYFMNV